MASERLPSMRRRVRPARNDADEFVKPAGERELLSGSYWHDHELDSWSDRLCVAAVPRRSGQRIDEGEGFVFYYWEPAYREIWPDVPVLIESTQPAPNEPTQSAPIGGLNTATH
jgi:hypothetical protein